MKSTHRLGAAGAAMIVALGMASAANAAPVTATANANAEVVRALTIVKATDLDFGKVAVAGAGTVTVDPDGTLSSCSANLTCYSTTSGAKFDVTTGSIGATLTVTLPANATLLRSGGTSGTASDEITLAGYTTNATNNAGVYTISLLDDGSGTNGVGTFSFGGTLTFDGSEVEGVYTTTISSNVDYQ
jgi:hypothetical protein